MSRQLVLAGGGHAHMVVLENIRQFREKGYGVTVIGPSDYHYYSGMGPGMLGGTYSPGDIRFATRDVVEKQGGTFIRDYVERIDPVARTVVTRSGESVSYDVLSCNAGSQIPMDMVAGKDNVYPVKPIEKLMEAAEKLTGLFARRKINVSVVGGGPSSAEVAGNVWQLARKTGGHEPIIRIFSGSRFMARFPEGVRRRVRSILEKRGIEILENGYVDTVSETEICLASGNRFETDFTFMASGVTPSPIFEASGLETGPDRGLLTNRFLQHVEYPEIFGGGDCIHFQDQPLDKVGVYAVRENPVLLHNLMAALDGGALMPFDPGPDYLLIFNLGGGLGVLKKRYILFGGRLAFTIKDYIDRKFMTKFQAIEKRL